MFKCFKFIDDMIKKLDESEMYMISEADEPQDDAKPEEGVNEEEADAGAGDGEQTEEPTNEETPMESQPMDANSDPSQIANPDQGQFISELGDAQYASIMVRALASNPVYKDKIPQEFLNAQTTENAQQIIQFCKNLLGIQEAGGETGFGNMTDEEIMNMPV